MRDGDFLHGYLVGLGGKVSRLPAAHPPVLEGERDHGFVRGVPPGNRAVLPGCNMVAVKNLLAQIPEGGVFGEATLEGDLTPLGSAEGLANGHLAGLVDITEFDGLALVVKSRGFGKGD